MENRSSICPICEGFNSQRIMVCRHCGQDLGINPLGDYMKFIQKPTLQQKADLVFQLGTLRHKLNLSFNTLQILSEQGKTSRINRVFKYYRRMMELDTSSATYYLLLFSRELFYRYYGTIIMSLQSYFILWRTYLMRREFPDNQRIEALFRKGLDMITDQKEKLIRIIEALTDNIESLDENEIAGNNWTSPPPPAICWMLTEIRRD